jgi:hypothetical protein
MNEEHGHDKGICGVWCNPHHGGGVGFGVLLLVIGGYFIAQDAGYISANVSFWPVALAALGLYFIAKGMRR